MLKFNGATQFMVMGITSRYMEHGTRNRGHGGIAPIIHVGAFGPYLGHTALRAVLGACPKGARGFIINIYILIGPHMPLWGICPLGPERALKGPLCEGLVPLHVPITMAVMAASSVYADHVTMPLAK